MVEKGPSAHFSSIRSVKSIQYISHSIVLSVATARIRQPNYLDSANMDFP